MKPWEREAAAWHYKAMQSFYACERANWQSPKSEARMYYNLFVAEYFRTFTWG